MGVASCTHIRGKRDFVFLLGSGIEKQGRADSGELWGFCWVIFLNVAGSCGCVEYPCPWQGRAGVFWSKGSSWLLPVLDSLT